MTNQFSTIRIFDMEFEKFYYLIPEPIHDKFSIYLNGPTVYFVLRNGTMASVDYKLISHIDKSEEGVLIRTQNGHLALMSEGVLISQLYNRI